MYLPFRRTWILLFPEGGFLRKRREVSLKFAEKNNLPVLHHVTVPRVGAVQSIVNAVNGPSAKDVNVNGHAGGGHRRVQPGGDALKWIIDLTIAYPNGKPIDVLTILSGIAPPCSTVFHYRRYPIAEVRHSL